MAKKILLADDSVTIQKVVELTFSEADYDVTCVSNGTHALERVHEIRPHIVLLDVILPGRNGYEVCDAIKKDPALSRTPVLLLTGTFEPFDRRRAESVGADGHLTKPFESQVLVDKVTELLRTSRRGRVSTDVGMARIINEGEEYAVFRGPQPGPPAASPAAPPPSPAPPTAPQASGRSLSPDELDAIARLVVDRLSDRIVREIAWEVVPDLAERLVRQRIRQIEEEP